MDSRFRGNDGNPVRFLASFPQRRESVISHRETNRPTPDSYAAIPQKVKPFIWGEQLPREFIAHEFS
jgi:hypothetical protein